ncbi:hypothetical protein [Streptomyces iakyrus]|uniref:hypothetical protein n=1 Tax=Streptomyces iakyrus TaxID=68219 RepID=UPI0033E968F9
MRRTALAPLALVAVLLGSHPASAAAGNGWEPAPSAPWDVAAGVRCDFPVHGEPVVDEVVRRVLSTYPDGSARRVAYQGDLVIRVTNTGTGASHDADASGSAVVEYRRDGSQRWAVHGPVFVGVGEGGGTLPRGLYIVDGVYTMDIGATGYKSVHLLHGTTDDLCARIG